MKTSDKSGNKTPKIKPKKQLGQNFLAQTGIIQKLAAAAGIRPGDTILEIGPGTGNLTAELAKTGNSVAAVEKDIELIPALEQRFIHAKNVRIVPCDARHFDETAIAPPYKVVANLPFYLTAPIIRKFLESANPPMILAVIVQKEVAQRICAAPPQSNLLAISVQFYAAPKIIGYVSKGNFWPVPKVDCAILRLEPYKKEGERYNKDFIAKFFRIAKAGFSHPRKQLAGNLAAGLKLERGRINGWLTENNLPVDCRAQTLSLENWIGLARNFDL